MQTNFERRLPIPGTYNIRDLGGYAAGDHETRWRRVLRADALHRIQPDAVQQLIEAGLRTVIDLRHRRELEAAPNPFLGHGIVRFVHIALFDDLDPRQAADDQGRPRSLHDLYMRAVESRQDAIRQVLTAIADAGHGGVLFHCTAGKDRTGIVAALLLSLVGVSRQTILDDYAATGSLIAPLVDGLIADAAARGHDIAEYRKFLVCEPEILQAVLDHLDARHGSIADYLHATGIDSQTLKRLRARLLDI